ncbi:hypothetical protein AGMMS50293_17030 [Spirochaetia bacterium]|nr:hypothetical protein AGMMS50293_17030 [Spirochaetia bacterium]
MTGRGFVWKGKTLLSGIDPTGRAERTANAIPITDRTLYLCPSPLYGYGLERLLARLAEGAPHSALLCPEADKELYDLSLQNCSPSLLANKKLRITDICECAALCAFVRQSWGARNFRRVEIVRLSGGWQLFPALYDSLAEALRREIATDWGNALTLARLGRRYIRNALRNLALIPRFPSIAELSWGAAPVLVLGAGPSLDAVLDGLARHFGDCPPGDRHSGGTLHKRENRPFKIVCVDTCLPALRERNIVPDLAVILESQHWNLRDFIGSLGWDVPAAMDLSALPETGQILAGGLFLFMTPWTTLRIFDRLKALLPASILPLGSVGLSAVELARRLSSGKILVAGIDFSFTLDSYHARSTPGHKDKLRRHNRFQSLLNAGDAFAPAAFSAVSKSGGQVRSNPAMRSYRSLFEQEFATESRLFDIAGSGLPLGIKTLSPEEAFDALGASGALKGGSAAPGGNCAAKQTALTEALKSFLQSEKNRLTLLRSILTGEAAAEQLGALIDECDYLWAHFPDYAAAGGRRPVAQEIAAGTPAAISFLKRLRAEIDPALALLERVMESVPK